MKPTKDLAYSVSEALAGIMVFEYVERSQEQDKFKRYYERDGVCEVRHMCLIVGAYIDRLYDTLSISEVYCEPFDLELVPRVLEALEDPFRADLVKIQKAILEVVQQPENTHAINKAELEAQGWQREARGGHKLTAIKLYRALHNVTLRVACLAVTDYMQGAR